MDETTISFAHENGLPFVLDLAPAEELRGRARTSAFRHGISGAGDRSGSHGLVDLCRTYAAAPDGLHPTKVRHGPEWETGRMLTEKQGQLLRVIDASIRKDGCAPSYDEMARLLGLLSKSGVHRLITALEERGFIRRIPNRARAIEVLRLPEDAAATGRPKPTPQARAVRQAGEGPRTGVREIPVMGLIAAGSPIAAIQSRTGTLVVSDDMLGPGEHFALVARGDSMTGAGILDGDTVIVRRQDHAVAGEIVVALVDGEEATLKRLRRRGTDVALEPANPAYEARSFGEARVRVQGVLAGLYRRV